MEARSLRDGLLLVVAVLTSAPVAAQQVQRFPLRPPAPRDEPVAPFFEGWFRNDDGTFTLSFGYFNLNTEQVVELPIGPDNFIEPAELDGKQPTHFPVEPRRDRGVFTLTVPADYADGRKRVVWTLRANGKTTSVPGRVGVEALQLDYGPRAMGSVPPLVWLEPTGMTGQHPTGVTLPRPKTVAVGRPLTLTVSVSEVSERAPDDTANSSVSVKVTWFKHQGPAAPVVFDPKGIEVEGGAGEATTTVTFSEPGDYVLRVRVDNFDANDSDSGDQCCWTNGYVPVTVTPGSGSGNGTPR